MLAILEAGQRPDTTALTRTFGEALSWLLGDLFQGHEAAYRYWTDGVLIDWVALQPHRIITLKGRLWVADHRTQWQVPAESVCGFAEGETPALTSLLLRIGNAAFESLEGHQHRNVIRREPQQWLLEFEVDNR